MYKIKQIPEDFIVMEINKLDFDENGEYSYYLLKKKNYNTIDAISKVCNIFRVDDKFANFAGTKDRVAVTEQYISINRGPEKDLNLNDIELKFLGHGKERLNLGMLDGNVFEITVRNIIKIPKKNEKLLIINYFDDQRFGKNNDNHIIGKLIIKGKFEEACKMLPECEAILSGSPNNFVGALRSIPKKILKLYIHAYQSHLWNKTAEEISKKQKTNIKIPIIGFGTEFNEKKIEKICEKILKEENVNLREFIIRKIPDLSDEGTKRDLYVIPKNLDIGKLEDDELNSGMQKVKIKFFLPPGAYATNVIKSLFE